MTQSKPSKKAAEKPAAVPANAAPTGKPASPSAPAQPQTVAEAKPQPAQRM